MLRLLPVVGNLCLSHLAWDAWLLHLGELERRLPLARELRPVSLARLRLAVTVCLPFALHRPSALLTGEFLLLTGAAGAPDPRSLTFLLSLFSQGELVPPEGMGACDAAGRQP